MVSGNGYEGPPSLLCVLFPTQYAIAMRINLKTAAHTPYGVPTADLDAKQRSAAQTQPFFGYSREAPKRQASRPKFVDDSASK